MTRLNRAAGPSLFARKTYSELCSRLFDSKAEARRGEDLRLLELDGQISRLKYQVKFVLSEKPRVTITIDFAYYEKGELTLEDTKGVMTREFRVKLAWLKQLHGLTVKLSN